MNEDPFAAVARRSPTALAQALATFLIGAALLCLAPAAAHAWTAPSQYAIGEQAARLTPPDLYRQIVRHRVAFREGMVDPYRNGDPQDTYKLSDGRGRLDEAIKISSRHAIDAIRAHQPFREVVFRLGVVAHYVALANNPLYTDATDPQQGRWAQDFLNYLESTQPRVEVVFYGFRRDLGPGHLEVLIRDTLKRGRALYPMVAREYQRVGYKSGIQAFDDRSIAYAVAALGYSHAVSDIAEVLRYIWLEAGGADRRVTLPLRGRQRIPMGRFERPSR